MVESFADKVFDKGAAVTDFLMGDTGKPLSLQTALYQRGIRGESRNFVRSLTQAELWTQGVAQVVAGAALVVEGWYKPFSLLSEQSLIPQAAASIRALSLPLVSGLATDLLAAVQAHPYDVPLILGGMALSFGMRRIAQADNLRTAVCSIKKRR